MASRFDLHTIGAPGEESHRHHRLREMAALIAAFAGGLAVLVVGFIVVAGVGPENATWAWIALPVLIAIWLTGLWWRWDAPDRRNRSSERVRRGY